MWEGGGGQDGVEWGREWDNCNSIINKYIKKKKKTKNFGLKIKKSLSRRKQHSAVSNTADNGQVKRWESALQFTHILKQFQR